jgi:Family of unknown function (DUF6184)
MTRHKWTGVLAVAVASAGFLFGYGCGNVTSDRDAAINTVTSDACARYQACGAIGPSAGANGYPSISDCQAAWKAKFTTQWPANECEGRIDQSMLGVCRSRIMSTSCDSVVDVLVTFEVTCSAAAVCDLPSDAGRG